MKPIQTLRAAVLLLSLCVNSWNAVSQVALAIVGSTNIGSSLDVQVSGHYTYLANGYGGLRICDVSDPSNPVSVGQAASIGYPGCVTVSGQYAYLVTDTSLNVYDVSAPSNPVLVGSTNSGGTSRSIIVTNNIAYVTGPGLGVYDVSDPAHPTKIGQAAGGWFQGVLWGGNFYQTAPNTAHTLYVFDVTTPSAPTNIYVSGGAYLWGIAISGNHLFAASESFSRPSGTEKGLLTFDVSNPANPVYVNSTSNSINGARLAISGKFVYMAEYFAGGTLKVYDVSNPTNLALVGQVGGLGSTSGLAVSGNHAYVSTTSGLKIVVIRPLLTISQLNDSNIILSWPATAPFALQENTDVAAGNWMTLTNTPTEVGARSQVLLPNPSNNAWFRLVSQ